MIALHRRGRRAPATRGRRAAQSRRCTPATRLVAWTAGNVSARVPGHDLMVIKPSGVVLRRADRRRRWSSCDLDGTVVDGELARRATPPRTPTSTGRCRTSAASCTRTAPTRPRGPRAARPIPCVLTAMADEFGGEIPVGPFALIGDDDDRQGHRRDADRPPLARRAHAQPRRLHHRRGRQGRGQGGGHVRGRRPHRAPRARARRRRSRSGASDIDALYARYQNVYGQR